MDLLGDGGRLRARTSGGHEQRWPLLKRISGIRKQIANDLGIIVQPIHMRDNLMLKPAEYRVLLSGQEIARGEIRPRRLLAMNPAGGAPDIEGEVTVEPAFGLDARWIFEDQKEKAELMGYTVVDAPTVAATHLGEILTSHAASLLGRRELQELLEIHGRDNAKVIEELIPDLMNHGQLIKVLRNLLSERLSVRDFRTILEALADFAGDYKDADQLSELVRQRMSRQITAMVVNEQGAVPAIVWRLRLKTSSVGCKTQLRRGFSIQPSSISSCSSSKTRQAVRRRILDSQSLR